MKKDDCIFCKLSNGDIPTNALYEDDVVKVIFDLNPASKGSCTDFCRRIILMTFTQWTMQQQHMYFR